MVKTFFEQLINENTTGVAYKNLRLKKAALSYFANVGNATIADLSKELNLSVPKVTSLINELISDDIVQENGKIETNGGRKPILYGLLPQSALFIGVDVKKNHVNLGLSDLNKKLIKVSEKLSYNLDNSKESLEELCRIIKQFVKEIHARSEERRVGKESRSQCCM